MGRNRRLLQEEAISVRLPSQRKPSLHRITEFWAHDKNTDDLACLKASHLEQCYFHKLCRRHYSLIAPKSLLHNFSKLKSTSLDCKPCKLYNNPRYAVEPSHIESVAYFAVSCLAPALAVAQEDMLVDHKLLGLSGSTADIYLPCLKLCIMVDGEMHFKDHRDTTAEAQESIDDRFNTEAVQKGLRVLRLHHEDCSLYSAIVKVAVQRCLAGTYGSLDFSKAYGDDIRRHYRLPLLH